MAASTSVPRLILDGRLRCASSSHSGNGSSPISVEKATGGKELATGDRRWRRLETGGARTSL